MSRSPEFLEAYDQGATDIIDSIIETFNQKGPEFTISGQRLIATLAAVKEDIYNMKGTV